LVSRCCATASRTGTPASVTASASTSVPAAAHERVAVAARDRERVMFRAFHANATKMGSLQGSPYPVREYRIRPYEPWRRR